MHKPHLSAFWTPKNEIDYFDTYCHKQLVPPHYLNLIKSTEKIKFAIDINASKFEKFLPSSYIPIKSDDFFYKNVSDNDLVIISNLNYEIEIKRDISINSDKNIKIITL